MTKYQILLTIAVTILQLAVPAFFIGRNIYRGELRVRFSLGNLFALMTIIAVSFGILRLDWLGPVKWLILFGFLVCACGLLAARLPPMPARRTRTTDTPDE